MTTYRINPLSWYKVINDLFRISGVWKINGLLQRNQPSEKRKNYQLKGRKGGQEHLLFWS